MATKLKVTYSGGKTVEVVASPRAQVMTEQYLRGIGDRNQLQAAYYLAWASLNRAGKEAAEYEVWLDSIDDVEQVQKSLREAIQDLLEGRDLDETPQAAQILQLAEKLDGPVEDVDRPTQRDRSPDPSSSSASAPASPSSGSSI